MTRHAAVTGIGLVTPVGSTLAEVFDAAAAGRSGITRPPAGHPLDGIVQAAGISPPIDATEVLPATEARFVDRSIVLALRAAEAALADAGIKIGEDVDPYRVAVIAGGTAGFATMEEQVVLRTGKGRLGVSPFLLPGVLPNMAAARIAIAHGVHGFASSIGTACAAGAQALGEALRLLRADEMDVVVCGGTEAPLFPTFADAFANARALARGWDDPAEASRPFDRRRNGFVLGEGAGMFVLERPEFAAARAARRHADLLGWGATCDAHHPTTPRPDGSVAAGCMRRALRDAAVNPGEIGYVNAHGTATKAGDAAEAAAIRAAFGDRTPPVSSTKGVTGHLLAASGAVEAAISVGALVHGLLPPTRNLGDPDPVCDLDHVRGGPRPAGGAPVLSNSFGFGGHNVSLVFGP